MAQEFTCFNIEKFIGYLPFDNSKQPDGDDLTRQAKVFYGAVWIFK